MVLPTGLVLALLAGCATVQAISPNDPAYNDSGAPGSATVPFGNGPRPYRPLGPEGPD
jgi:hypothetical protein